MLTWRSHLPQQNTANVFRNATDVYTTRTPSVIRLCCDMHAPCWESGRHSRSPPSQYDQSLPILQLHLMQRQIDVPKNEVHYTGSFNPKFGWKSIQNYSQPEQPWENQNRHP